MLKKLCILFVMLVTVAAPSLAAVNAVTEIQVRVPSILILYYRPAVEFDVSSTLPSVLGLASGESTELESGTAVLTSLTGGDAGVDGLPISFNDPSALSAQVSSFWAVRSINANDTRVTVSLASPAITNGGSTILMSNVETGFAGVFGGNSVDFGPSGLGFVNIGDVRFDVDFSGVNADGLHAGGQIQITAENL